jgi:hypothetical protein
MRSRLLSWLRALPSWGLDEHTGRIGVIASQAALWLTIMSGLWVLPNEISVWLRVGVTFFWSMLAGLIIRGACVEEQEAQDQHRRKNHLCLHCGYDLRATPDRCPECGEEPPEARAARYAERRARRRLRGPVGAAPAHKKAGAG